jgi:hypothetical protein
MQPPDEPPIEGLELREATDEDVLNPAMLTLANTNEAPWPMLYFLVERGDETGPIAEIPLPHLDVLRSLCEQSENFNDMPWGDLNQPLHAVVLVVHALVHNPLMPEDKGQEMHVRICGAALANRGYCSAWQPAHDERYAIAVGETPEGWDAIATDGHTEYLHALYFKINQVIRDRKAAAGG